MSCVIGDHFAGSNQGWDKDEEGTPPNPNSDIYIIMAAIYATVTNIFFSINNKLFFMEKNSIPFIQNHELFFLWKKIRSIISNLVLKW